MKCETTCDEKISIIPCHTSVVQMLILVLLVFPAVQLDNSHGIVKWFLVFSRCFKLLK